MSIDVAIARCKSEAGVFYPPFPYLPSQPLPELPDIEIGGHNPVFAAVRDCLALLGLDRENYGTARWNPFRELIKPAQRVLIKPNWVHHANSGQGGFACLLTHSSVLRPVIEYVLLALKGRGRILIADAPLQSADFGQIVERTEIARLAAHLKSDGADIQIRDFRANTCEVDAHGRVVGHVNLAGDPDGYATVDLGEQSFLCDVAQEAWRFRVTNYDPSVMGTHHSANKHEYLIAKAVLDSDVVINVPKLKTHRKTGLTCCLKNLVGINGSKDYLPHHRVGAADQGGDEYRWPSMWKRLGSAVLDRLEHSPGSVLRTPYRLAHRICRRMAHHFAGDPYSEGSWYGNDTTWRMVLDLNRILQYATPEGVLAGTPQRQIFQLVDAIVAGEGEGPLRPDPVNAGFILAGREAATVDACAARLVGLDYQRMPLVRNALKALPCNATNPPDYGFLVEGPDSPGCPIDRVQPIVRARPPSGWVNYVELPLEEYHATPSPRASVAGCSHDHA